MLGHLLSKLKVIESLDVNIKDVDNNNYLLNKEGLITEFALNIILILEGSRLAYKADIDDPDINKFLIREALNYDSSLSCLMKDEPIIFLKSNLQMIVDEFKNNADHDLFLGKVLGYHYTGPYWIGCSNGDTYTISYQTVSSSLYAFNIPVCEYNQNVKNKILDTLRSHNLCLNKYGYEVTLLIIHQFENNNVQVYYTLP